LQVFHVLGHCVCDPPSGRLHLPLYSHDFQEHFERHVPCRFFMFWAIVFVTHQVGVCIFRCTAMISRNIVVANGLGMLLLLCCILLDGFVIVKRYIHPWVVW